MSKEEQLSVGIDLGTTFSVVASVDRDGKPVTIPNDEGGLSTPSVVYFDSACTVVGNEAVNAAEFAPERTARFAKRDIGNDLMNRKILGNAYPPEVVLALILQKLKLDAELKIGKFDKAVVTVPAYFNEPRRKATQDAGRLAGIEVLDIINEPTAAAIAFGVSNGFVDQAGKAKEKERVLVYDLGGGTFDVTLMDIEGSDFNTIGTAGDVHLGGMDWDGRIMHHLADQFEEEHKIDPRSEPSSLQKLLQQATRAKKTLTARDQAQIRFALQGKQSVLSISRAEFTSLTEDLVERTRMTVKRLLKESKTSWSQVTRLLLVGGSTRMPMIHEMLESESGLKCDRSLSPDEAVAHGAAVYAQNLVNSKASPGLIISNVNSHDLGVLGRDPKTKKRTRQMMIPRNSKIPVTQRRKFVTSKDGQREVIVTVVEGGTDSGEGATRIGKCRVSDLPEGLPKNTPVFVTFQYAADGRLSVSAELPTVEVQARIAIQRSSGMSEEQLTFWRERIEAGIKIDTDEKVAHPSEKPEEPAAEKTPQKAPQAPSAKEGTAENPIEAAIVVPGSGSKNAAKKSPPASQASQAKPKPKPSKPAPIVPVFQEAKPQVDESQIIVGDLEAGPQPSQVSQLGSQLNLEEKIDKKVDESQIVLDNESDKPKSVKLDALDDFLKNMD